MTCSKSRLILRHFLVGKYTPPVTPLMFDFMDCLDQGRRGEGGKRRGLGPRNDVLTTCKAVTQRGGQRIITVFFPQ